MLVFPSHSWGGRRRCKIFISVCQKHGNKFELFILYVYFKNVWLYSVLFESSTFHVIFEIVFYIWVNFVIFQSLFFGVYINSS